MIFYTKKQEGNLEALKEITEISEYVSSLGLTLKEIEGVTKNAYHIIGDTTRVDKSKILSYSSVVNCVVIQTPYKLASREYHNEDTVVDVKGVKIGDKNTVIVMAGPCSIESELVTEEIGIQVKKNGAKIIRGGAYKPRTSPYSFQGLEKEGIYAFRKAADYLDMPIISEIVNVEDIDLFVKNVDIIQVGARNMQNYELLKALGKVNKPVLLKRGAGNTIDEFIMSAEYILAGGNPNVILCERGIRTFEHATRYTLDLSSVPLLKQKTHLPVIVDPSHSTGSWDLVESMSMAAVACGADGLLIEVHNSRNEAISDAKQTITTLEFKKMMVKLKKIANAIGKSI